MADTITIGPGEKLEAGQVAIWERDARHPDGEIYLADGDEPIEAYRTGAVQARIADGRLVETEARPKARPADTAPAPTPSQASVPPGATQTGAGDADPLAFLTDDQRGALAEKGFVTLDDIREASDDELDAVPGIGEATVTRLREAAKGS
jgi:hypothetical protein